MAKEDLENEQGEKAGGGGKKKLLKIIIFAVIGLLGIIIIAAVAFIFLSGDDKPKEGAAGTAQDQAAQAPQVQAQEQIVQNAAPEQAAPEMAYQGSNTEVGVIYPLPTFAMNLADPNGITFIKFGISLDLPAKNGDLAKEVETKLPLIQDLVIMIVSSKAYEEINTAQGKSNLKREILRRINERLLKGKVNGVYITDFVVQR